MQRKAYSLVEVMFVVILLAILAAIAIPRLGVNFTVKMKVKTAAQTLVSDLRYTRRLAVTNNENHKLSINSIANEYSIYDSLDSQVGETKSIDSSIVLSGDKNFIFESLGNASVLSDTSVSLSVDGNQADITMIVATGRINVSGP